MSSTNVSMKNWHKIWNNRLGNEELLLSGSLQEKFMELKRLTGNDTMKGGVPYTSYMKQYDHLKSDLTKRGGVSSVFEVGCGSGPYLMLFENEGIKIGGLDYSENLLKAAKLVLKNPLELVCDEALNLDTQIKYDAVFCTSAFEYFESDDYAIQVLEKMFVKANKTICVLDVHESSKEEAYVAYRRKTQENYDELYKDLNKKFYPRGLFGDFAKKKGVEIVFKDSCLEGYWNAPFVFDMYMYKH